MSGGWLLRLARYGFGAWLTLYGLTAAVSPNERIASSSLSNVATLIHIEPHHLFAGMFLLPGILVLIPRIRTLGLALALGMLSIFEIGLILSTIRGVGTYTAPVTFGFAIAVSALLLSLRDVP